LLTSWKRLWGSGVWGYQLHGPDLSSFQVPREPYGCGLQVREEGGARKGG
jgi:hypothetical protein